MNRARIFLPRVIVLAVVAVVFVALFAAYSTSKNPYALQTDQATTASSNPPLTNAPALQNWLAPYVYTYTLARISDYLRNNNLTATSLAMQGQVTFQPDTYDFDILLQPQQQVLAVNVKVTNFNASLSIAVTINGQLQAIQPVPDNQEPSNNSTQTTTYSGFEALVDQGMTAAQAAATQQAFSKFAPSAAAITIDTTTIHNIPTKPKDYSGIYTRTFSVDIDNKPYQATLRAIGLLKIELILLDANAHQTFDSGIVSQT